MTRREGEYFAPADIYEADRRTPRRAGKYFAPADIYEAGRRTPRRPCAFAATVGGDTTPPIITNYNPPLNSVLQPTQLIQFDLVELGGLVAVIVRCKLRGAKHSEMVYEYDAFVEPYDEFSTLTVVGNGILRFSIGRSDDGWNGWPNFRAFAIDRGGNINL